METTQRLIATLLRSAVTGEALPLPENFSLEEALPVIKRQGLATLCYEGAANCGISPQEPVMRELFQQYYAILLASERQMQQVNAIFRTFEENGIDYLPFKGCVMKTLYPKPELRVMGDADILIRYEQYPQIESAMNALGMSFQYDDGRCEIVWESKHLHVELHRCLIDPYNRTYYDYYGTGWEKAVHLSGSRYGMRDEDMFIHLLIHFTKHYITKGIGSRHVVDLWVFRRTHPNMDEAYIIDELKKLNLERFYENVREMIAAWFDGGTGNEATEYMTQYIFTGGTFGTLWNVYIYEEAKKARIMNDSQTTKGKTVRRMLLPEYEIMRQRYPVLEKAPYLLPVYWIYRWSELARKDRKIIRLRLKSFQHIEDNAVEEYRRALELVGLDASM